MAQRARRLLPAVIVVLRPEREVVAQQLHNKRRVLVALLVERVEFSDGVVEGRLGQLARLGVETAHLRRGGRGEGVCESERVSESACVSVYVCERERAGASARASSQYPHPYIISLKHSFYTPWPQNEQMRVAHIRVKPSPSQLLTHGALRVLRTCSGCARLLRAGA
eukprot:6214738-Pleurochrysis_carterae.AAC.1